MSQGFRVWVLFHSRTGHVCLTRSAEVAAYWALLERNNDEGRGSIFILDRQSLERRYKIDANPEVYWHSKTRFHDEAEEEILDNVVDVGNHLIGVVSGPTIRRSQRAKTLNRRFKNEIEARLLELAKTDDQLSNRQLDCKTVISEGEKVKRCIPVGSYDPKHYG